MKRDKRLLFLTLNEKTSLDKEVIKEVKNNKKKQRKSQSFKK
ncbi:17095_t:CDS:1, partial [Gigaspora margarita]